MAHVRFLLPGRDGLENYKQDNKGTRGRCFGNQERRTASAACPPQPNQKTRPTLHGNISGSQSECSLCPALPALTSPVTSLLVSLLRLLSTCLLRAELDQNKNGQLSLENLTSLFYTDHLLN